MDDNGLADPYLKLYLIDRNKPTKSQVVERYRTETYLETLEVDFGSLPNKPEEKAVFRCGFVFACLSCTRLPVCMLCVVRLCDVV